MRSNTYAGTSKHSATDIDVNKRFSDFGEYLEVTTPDRRLKLSLDGSAVYIPGSLDEAVIDTLRQQGYSPRR